MEIPSSVYVVYHIHKVIHICVSSSSSFGQLHFSVKTFQYPICDSSFPMLIYGLPTRFNTDPYRYTVQQKSNTKSAATRRLALEMYLEGLGFRAIGRILKISHTIVYYWVKEWGERVALPQKEGPVSVVELDEMHTYIGSKKTTVGYGLLLIDLENDLSLLSVGTEAQIQG